MRAQGPGGQNVNIRASSLPDAVKERLLALPGRRVSKEGVLVLKAQSARTQEQNRALALQRLEEIVEEASYVAPVRKATKPTYGSKQRRLKQKGIRSEVKAGRRAVDD